MSEQFEWAVAGLVVVAAGALALAAVVAIGLPLADYILTWWGIALW